MLALGSTPPDFTLLDQRGEEVHWSSFRGQPVVVFFFPKANTPGCTKEACAFNELGARFASLGVAVLGVSADSVKRQSNFAEKYGLRMPLLSDPEHTVLEPWGVWGEKKLYGKVRMGIIRSTFLFDAEGALVHLWPKVKVKGHAEAVLAQVTALWGDAS